MLAQGPVREIVMGSDVKRAMTSKTDRGNGPGGDGERAVRWVNRTAALAEVAANVAAGPLAVDTEADSFHHYRETVCLIQLSFGRTDALVDTLSGIDLSTLGGVLRDGGVRKILHGADYDVRMLERDCGLTLRGLFDTMVAARLVGERAFGLSALADKYLGVRLDKRHQRADWSLRPLPPELVRYAARDTRYLTALSDLLEARLVELDRTAWAEEEFRRLERLRWDENRREGEAWRRVKGVGTLTPRQLAVVCELVDLRERNARGRDVPLFRVMRDEVLVAAAREATSGSRGTVLKVPGLPRAWRQGRPARALLEAVERGLRRDARNCPEPPRRERPRRRTRGEEARLRRMGRERDRIAVALGLEPAVLAPRALLVRLAEQLDAGRPPEELAELRDWQLRLLGPVIEAAR
jgi:ribonuclease D